MGDDWEMDFLCHIDGWDIWIEREFNNWFWVKNDSKYWSIDYDKIINGYYKRFIQNEDVINAINALEEWVNCPYIVDPSVSPNA